MRKYNYITIFLILIIISNLIPIIGNANGFDGRFKGTHDSLWKKLDNGLFFIELQAKKTTTVGDYKVQILRINPENYHFYMNVATETDSASYPVDKWAEKEQYIAVFNAGMYELSDGYTARGYFKHKGLVNQPNIKDGFMMAFALNCFEDSSSTPKIIDLNFHDFNEVKSAYNTVFQSIRLIDEQGRPVYWQKKPEKKMSIGAMSVDSLGNIYWIISRSPMSANEFIDFLLSLDIGIRSTMYLEGGPETSFYISHKGFRFEKTGSFVSGTYENNKNDHFWDLPNVIGIRKKTENKQKE